MGARPRPWRCALDRGLPPAPRGARGHAGRRRPAAARAARGRPRALGRLGQGLRIPRRRAPDPRARAARGRRPPLLRDTGSAWIADPDDAEAIPRASASRRRLGGRGSTSGRSTPGLAGSDSTAAPALPSWRSCCSRSGRTAAEPEDLVAVGGGHGAERVPLPEAAHQGARAGSGRGPVSSAVLRHHVGAAGTLLAPGAAGLSPRSGRPSCSGVPIGMTSERSSRISVSVATAGSTATSNGASSRHAPARTSASTCRVRRTDDRQVAERAHPLHEPGPPVALSTTAARARSPDAFSTSCGTCWATSRAAQTPARATPAGGDRIARLAPSRARPAPLQSVTIATNGGAIC